LKFDFESIKDVTVDDVVKILLEKFYDFVDPLNEKIRKQNTKFSDMKYVVNALNKGINNPGD